ncbi:hypothetical protein B14911_19540 [Bacillus sp. NRRL B-14911]|nr:hypothetical protein B14911_19540 [Bacillus sp. NRRL B-14911]OXT15784.1 hypothetical protein B9K06_19520 [Bacillus sp. OG2]
MEKGFCSFHAFFVVPQGTGTAAEHAACSHKKHADTPELYYNKYQNQGNREVGKMAEIFRLPDTGAAHAKPVRGKAILCMGRWFI